MKTFKRFAIFSLIWTYLLIFVGGLVRVSGAGLGCPDWPKCFGRWIPPTDISQLPPGMDPNLFNFTLAWIEYVNRLFGVALGLIIVVTAVLAILKMRHKPRVLYSAIAAAVLVAFQGWQGSMVVSSALEPYIITIHLFTALVLTGVLIYMVYHAFSTKSARSGEKSYLFYVFLGYYLLLMLQIVIGTQIRSDLETLREMYPMIDSIELILRLGPVQSLHTWLGIGVGVGGSFLAIYTFINNLLPAKWQKQLMTVFAVLLILQIIFGFILIWVAMPPAMQLLHLWSATIGMGCILTLTIDQAQGMNV